VKKWTVKQCEGAGTGRHRVSESLYLFVGPDRRSRRWIFRFTSPPTKKVTEMGLGPVGVMTLAEAREKVLEARRLVTRGLDPIDQKRGKRTDGSTFASVAADYIEIQTRRFRNPNSAKNVQTLLLTMPAT
jgi:hypothetical protein